MKNIKELLLAGLVSLLFACGETSFEKQASETNESLSPGNGTSTANTAEGYKRNTMDDRTNQPNNNMPRTDAEETRTVSDEVNTATTPKFDNASNYDGRRIIDNQLLTRQTGMYMELGMNDSQRSRYERASREAIDKWKRDNPNKTMTSQQRMEIERNALRPVLDDEQFKSYAQWAQSNPYQD